MITKKNFLGGLNADDADFLVPEGDYIGAMNLRISTAENGDLGKATSVIGNSLRDKTLGGLTLDLPAGTNETIGTAVNHSGRRIAFFNWNSGGQHGIYCYDMDDEQVYKALIDVAPFTDGNLLKFSRDKYIHSAEIIDDKLYWTDDTNQPRRINIEAGIKMNHPSYQTTVAPYSNGITESVIRIVRNPPVFPLETRKVADPFVNNFIADGSFQFTYRFVYRDNEESVFGPFSALQNFNPPTNLAVDTINAIEVKIPLDQKIPQDVDRVEIAVRNMIGNSVFVIKAYQRGVDDGAINSHNSGSNAIAFNFLNNTRGLPVENTASFKPFDNVPIRSKTLALAKNRLFLGNNLYGHDAPKTTSLTIAPVRSQAGVVLGDWWKIEYNDGPSRQRTRYFIFATGLTDSGYYLLPPINRVPPLPNTAAFNLLTYIGAGQTELLTYLGITWNAVISFQPTGDEVEVTSPPAIATLDFATAFKSDSTYCAAIVFFDSARRKCAAIPADENVITPDRTFTTVAYTSSLRWSLENNVNEIPDWADTYSICLTKSLRTNSFVQLRADEVAYIIKNPTTGEYSTSGTYDKTRFGVAFRITSLNALGLGYTYQEGDLVKLYTGSAKVTLKVKDTWGEWVIADLYNFGAVDVNTGMLYEIYSPEFSNFNEIFYEWGNAYPIVDAGLPTRRYSVLSGDLAGDTYVVTRTRGMLSYQVETMSPRDTFWKLWFTNASRENIAVRGQTTRSKVDIAYSNTIILGSKVNGLSQFEVLNSQQLPSELGQINKLILANRVQGDGSVMLAVGDSETVSIYIGESQIFDSSGASFLAKSDNVIGQVNSLAGGYGSIHPESVFLSKRDIYFFDVNKSCWVRYSVNGLFPVSEYKMKRFFRALGEDIMKYLTDPTEYNAANGGYPLRVLGAENPFNDEAVICFPRMSQADLGVQLSDLPSFKTYYRVYDGQGGTLGFLPSRDRFTSFYSMKPDWVTSVGNRLVSFKSGRPWVHDGPENSFFGVVGDTAVAAVHSEAGNSVKSYLSLSIEGDEPDAVHVRTEDPNVQSTNIIKGEFGDKEGVFYSSILRDRLSPNASGTADQKMYTGDRIRGNVAKIQVVFSQPSERKGLKFVNIQFNPSRGHNT